MLGYAMQRETCKLEKKENGENIFFKALANRFRLTLKIVYGQTSGLHENGLPKWIS